MLYDLKIRFNIKLSAVTEITVDGGLLFVCINLFYSICSFLVAYAFSDISAIFPARYS